MIQINLIPDVKKEFLKAQRTKHTFVSMSILVSLIVAALTVLLFVYVQIFQPQYQKSIQNDIDQGLSNLKNQENAEQVLTVQAALKNLPGLQDDKLVSSRFSNYLQSITPRDIVYNEVQVNFENNEIRLNGRAKDLAQTTILSDNLKRTNLTYRQDDEEQTKQVFSEVIFKTLALSRQARDDKLASFELTFTFEPVMFDQTISNPRLRVSSGEQPSTNQTPFGEENNEAAQ